MARRAGRNQKGGNAAKGAKRRFHLGLDWGTSSTKMVLRDLRTQQAYVLNPDGADDGYRYPSAVHVARGKVLLGAKGREVAIDQGGPRIPPLKVMTTDGKMHQTLPGAEGFSGYELAVLYLAHAMHLGLRCAQQLAARAGEEAVMSVTMGVPTEQSWREFPQTRLFLDLARTAYEIGVRMETDTQGISVRQGRDLLRDVGNMGEGESDEDLAPEWLRPELAAAMLWPFRHPAVEPGLCGCIDVGAWTTNVSFFRFRHRREDDFFERKGGISFFGGTCRPYGMNAVCELLAKDLGNRRPEDLWGAEDDHLEGREHLVAGVVEEIVKSWELGRRRAYAKEPKESAWKGVRVHVVGGGSKVGLVRRSLRASNPFYRWSAREVPDLGVPEDLFEYPTKGPIGQEPFRGDPAFLFVAYGLSYLPDDFPEFDLSGDVPEWEKDTRVRPGMCVDCGARPPIPGETKCRSCAGW